MTTRPGRQAPIGEIVLNPGPGLNLNDKNLSHFIRKTMQIQIKFSSMYRLSGLLLGLVLALHSTAALSQSNFDQLPDLGDSSGQTISPQQDIALGKAFMRQVRQS